MRGVALYGEDFFIIKENQELIKENITRILLTSPGERVNNPDFGSPLKDYIFEKETIVRGDIRDKVKAAIERWEPTISVIDITLEEEKVNDDVSTLSVEIKLFDTETLLEFNYETLIRY